MLQLYTYHRSSASYRVRIALNLKGLEVEHIPVNLLKLEQKAADYATRNPQQLLPTLVTEQQVSLTQSLAIIEYLEEQYPTPPLLPLDKTARARVRALAQAVACEMAPLNNLRVLNYLVQQLGASEGQKRDWYQHWIAEGFAAVESLLQDDRTGRFCHGDTPGMADCCLIPQVYNARRFECDMTPFPTINRIVAECEGVPAFVQAHPSRQADAI